MIEKIQTMLNKKLPSFFGFATFALSLVVIGWLSANTILFGTKAATDETPRNIQISNVSDTTFTISYLTTDQALGTITYASQGQAEQVALDEQDKKNGTATERTVHHISVSNLTPETTYTFSITSGSQIVQDNGQPFTVTTGPKLDSTDGKQLLMGNVISTEGKPASDSLVSLSYAGSQLLSTITDNAGNYSVDLAQLRTQDLTKRLPLQPTDRLQMTITNATEQSTISLLVNQAESVPLIILSKNYDFQTSEEPLTSSPIASDSATQSDKQPAFPIQIQEGGTTPRILTPEKEQGFNDQQPLFRGTAVPNETVTITINSEQTITATITADGNGNWQYRPDEELEPGIHTITIRSIDAQGLIRIITQQFTVYAEGSQFTEPSISPSITITPTVEVTTPTVQPTTQTPTVSPTSSPTEQPSPIITESVTTLSPSPTAPAIPVTGNSTTIALIIGIISAIAIGALLLLFAAV